MTRIAKKATQDGTFTVYVENKAVVWGLTGDVTLLRRLG
jgi:hypothetical protein